MNRWTLWLGLAVSLPALAAPRDEVASVASSSDYVVAREASSVSIDTLRSLLQDGSASVRLTARAMLARSEHPELAAQIDAAQPRLSTRDGRPRFALEALSRPGAGPLVLERLLHGGDPLQVRLALLGNLPAHEAWGTWVAEAWPFLDEPELRATSLQLLARTSDGGPLLERGLGDTAPLVRAMAARMSLSVTGPWQPALLGAVTDDSAMVRASAVRSLGFLGGEGAADAVRARLSDASAEVRQEAVSAALRLDPDAGSWPELLDLRADPDPGVRSRVRVQLAPP